MSIDHGTATCNQVEIQQQKHTENTCASIRSHDSGLLLCISMFNRLRLRLTGGHNPENKDQIILFVLSYRACEHVSADNS